MDGLKQRIIGALVLVSLAVIFVPMIFDEPHSERQSTPITIPEVPPFPEVNLPQTPASEEPRYLEDAQGGKEVPQPPADEGTVDYQIIESGESPASAAGSAPVAPVDDAQAAPPTATDATQMPADSQTPDTGSNRDSAAGAEQSAEEDGAEFTRSLEGAWVVQLGSFGNEDNARRLRDRVVDMGYGAHLQQVTQSGQTFTRVFSGPFVNKSDAEKAKTALDSAFGLNSLVTSGDK
ncbi:MAG TPA: SPOR domain-containing protein [Marinobacter sp.]|nr:SPOR domain-containing protein [Marinobacter sp.]